ncbi:MAG: flagellar filament capping protein FliD, partial [Oscillospiraceae bacterium]
DGQANTVGMGDTLGNVLGSNMFADKIDIDGKPVLDASGKPVRTANFSINGKSIEVSETDTISAFMRKINTSGADVKIEYSELENRFVMSRNSSGAGFDIKVTDSEEGAKGLLGKVFGTTFTSDVVPSDTTMYKPGANAKLTIDGVVTERSSNNFTVNGINFELLSTTENGKDIDGNAIFKTETITTTRNTDTIFEGIKSFVDEYNTLIKELNGLVDAKEEYKDFPPLTDAQRKDMSKSEIDAWEKKAQTGLLRGDNDVSSFLSQMRLALYQKPDGAKYALFNIGIETSKDWKENGKLEINEVQLKKMINSDPAAIQELFTFSKTKEVDGQIVPDGTQGIATALKDIMKKTANTSSGSPGALVKLAGVEGMATESNNILSKDMSKMNDKIKSLKVQYEKEKSRYWRDFNSMEKVLANLSSQSGWLSQQFAQ